MQTENKNLYLAKLFLRIGLAFVFLYAAIAAFLSPNNWVGFLPVWLENIAPRETLLTLFSSFEIILAAWLLWGKHLFYAAALSTLTILGIIITSLNLLDITFRDVGLLFAGLALIMLSENKWQKV